MNVNSGILQLKIKFRSRNFGTLSLGIKMRRYDKNKQMIH